MNTLLTSHAWQVAAWTMLHFLWIGTAIALVGMLLHFALARLSRQRPGLRYAAALFTLAVFTVAPLGIAWHLSLQTKSTPEVTLVEAEPLTNLILPPQETDEPLEPLVIDLAETPLHTPPMEASPSSFDEQVTNVPSDSLHAVLDDPTNQQPATSVSRPTTEFLAPRALQLVTYLPWLWLVGAPLTFAFLTTGLVGSAKLRRTAKPLDALGKSGDTLEQTLSRLTKTLAISRKIAVGVSDSLAQPILIGIIRPMILLPSAALSNCTPEELEMILLHELTHVRRWDNLVNFAQRIVESLLFFHPCVWWLSRQVRVDREQCVDAAVVARTAKPQAYAELLVNFAAARNQLPPTLAASAMARHPLAGRVRKILNLEDEPMLVKRSIATLAGLAVLVVLSLLVWQPTLESVAKEPKPKRVAQLDDTKVEGLSSEDETNEPKNSTQGEAASLATDETDRTDGDEDATSGKKTVTPKGFERHRFDMKDELILPPGNSHVIESIVKHQEAQGYSVQVSRYDDGKILITRREPGKKTLYDKAKKFSSEAKKNEVQAYTKTFGEQYLFKKQVHDDGTFTLTPFTTKSSEIKRVAQFSELSREGEANEQKNSTLGEAASLATDDRYGADEEDLRIAQDQLAEIDQKIETAKDQLEEIAKEKNKIISVLGASKATAAKVELKFHSHRMKIKQEINLLVKDKITLFDKHPELITQITNAIADDYEQVSDDEQRTPKPRPATNSSPFPTLEEQRAADLVYKLLNVEVEKLSEEELKRVKAKKFVGGLKVTSVRGSEPTPFNTRKASISMSPLQPGDLLVGLHVWPTTSLADIQTIFERDDIDELSPLKFYVIRQEMRPTEKEMKRQIEQARKNSGGGEFGGAGEYGEFGGEYGASHEPEMEAVDLLITGRIEPNLEAWRTIQQRREAKQTQAGNKLGGERTPEKAVSDQRLGIRELETDRSDHTREIEMAQREIERLQIVYNKLQDRIKKEGVPRVRRELESIAAGTSRELAALQQEQRARQMAATEARKQTPTYLYAGKPFEHWRDLFKYELSTERRIEAIKALAAFGRTGKGKEAAEAILDVAGEYDFREGNNLSELEDELAGGILDALSKSISTVQWLPILEKRFENEPAKWRWITEALLDRARRANPQFKAKLFELAVNSESSLRELSTSLLVKGSIDYTGSRNNERVTPRIRDPRVKELLAEMLASSQPERVKHALSVMICHPDTKKTARSGAIYMPEIIPALLNDDEEIQQQSRMLLSWLSDTHANRAYQEISPLLEHEKTSPENQLAVIRAIAVLRKQASDAAEELKKIVTESNTPELKIAAAVALGWIGSSSDEVLALLRDKLSSADSKALSDDEIKELLIKEARTLLGN